MSLTQHVVSRQLTDKQVAAELKAFGLDCTPQAVGLWKRGERRPRDEAMFALIRWSEHNVRVHGAELAALTVADFYPAAAPAATAEDAASPCAAASGDR